MWLNLMTTYAGNVFVFIYVKSVLWIRTVKTSVHKYFTLKFKNGTFRTLRIPGASDAETRLKQLKSSLTLQVG